METSKQPSLVIDTGGASQSVSISTTSAQSAAITARRVVIYANIPCFVRRGSNPTALANGTDQYLPANIFLPLEGWASGEKLAFITASGSGTVYITPAS